MNSNPSTDAMPLMVLSPPDAESLATGVFARVRAKEARIIVTSFCSAGASFANNDVQRMTGASGTFLRLDISQDGRRASGMIQGATTEDLAALVDEVEDMASHHREKDSQGLLLGPAGSFADPQIYFESSLAAGKPTVQGDVIREAATLADTADLIGAGDLGSLATSVCVLTTTGFKGYSRRTFCEFSMTARTRSGAGSGWAWGGSEDFRKMEVQNIAKQAIANAQRSEKPVAIEPGHYVVILEPAAVADFVTAITRGNSSYMSAFDADTGSSVFSKLGGGNKIGSRVAGEHVQLFYDPMDPLLPFSPMDDSGRLLSRTHWIENGILTNLSYNPYYALERKRQPLLDPLFASLAITAPTQTLEEMIGMTKRGIWVHRLGGIELMDAHTLLLTGVTRDGTFLIENGRVTKAIKNMRFSESPLFVLNKLAASGAPVRSSQYTACPRLKVHDFEFTSLSDAI